ncbi:hypothetical protein KOW79_007705 [Hemibagrus wyckioides]|uniref:Uncharacterized protein n=1 Tax=Hemibagrus wyckioides TaxID=337641 RepID=A0A9D3NUB3_9TELE|nr:hypothetical protein KOW79_007705 [Hemibagrus wyckioides]
MWSPQGLPGDGQEEEPPNATTDTNRIRCLRMKLPIHFKTFLKADSGSLADGNGPFLEAVAPPTAVFLCS